jgi:polo-like kinase 4
VTEDHLRGVLKGVVEALIYLKKQSIVHRKIKPSNVLLTTEGRIVSFPSIFSTQI